MPQENEVVQLHLDDIIPNRFQPREIFDEKALKELAVSIKEHGVIQPIIVRNIGNKYEIIAGERRYKASALAGLTKIPAIVRNLDDKETSKVALLENLQRKNLNPIEEARTYQKILELDQMTQEGLAKTMGKSQGAIANKLRLLTLPEVVQDAVLKEQISERHARSLLGLSDPEEQKKMLKRIMDEKMTVRELEKTINPDKVTPKEEKNGLEIPLQNTIAAPSIQEAVSSSKEDGAIDYSTPPKFINYDLDEEDPDADAGVSNAIIPPDINALRQTAQDINFDSKKPADLDNLLQVSGQNEKTEGSQQSFKFFNMNPEVEKQSPSSTSTPHTMADEYFKVPDIQPVPEKPKEPSSVDAFQIPLIQNSENQTESVNPANFIPKSENSLQSSIDKVKASVMDLKAAGAKIEMDEMDFDNNYQIVIRIMKD